MRQELFAFWRFFIYLLCCIFYLNLRIEKQEPLDTLESLDTLEKLESLELLETLEKLVIFKHINISPYQQSILELKEIIIYFFFIEIAPCSASDRKCFGN